MSLTAKDVDALLTPSQPCSVCRQLTPFFGVCRRCHQVLARCDAHGGAGTGLDEELQQHRARCPGAPT